MPSTPRRSVLHRFLGITPGAAPAWLCSLDGCQGFDLFVAVEDSLIIVGLVLGPARGFWWPLLIALAAVTSFGFCVHVPFERYERRARARRRRGECVWCGRHGFAPGSGCPECAEWA
jgi:hypothetical protein